MASRCLHYDTCSQIDKRRRFTVLEWKRWPQYFAALFSHCLNMRWLCGLFWPAECGRSDTGRLLSLGLKETCSFTLLGHGPDSPVKRNWSGLLERRTVGQAEPSITAITKSWMYESDHCGPSRLPSLTDCGCAYDCQWGQSTEFGGIQCGYYLNPLSSEMVVGDWYS